MKKWGIYLRAPDTFLKAIEKRPELLRKLSTLVETRFGTLTGWNEFYCPTPRDAPHSLFQKIGPKYKVPLIRTVKDLDRFVADASHCEGELFVCNEKKAKLKGAGTRAYIAWGEKQKKDGVLRAKSGEMARRDPWYSTRDPVKGDVIFPMFVGGKHFCISNPKTFAITNNLLSGTVKKKKHRKIVAAITNSSWFAMCCELYGRVNLGEGALKIEKTDLDEIPIPDFELFSAKEIDDLDKAFPLPIEKEVQQEDRQRIDAIVAQALKLTADEDEEVRQAVVELNNERALVSELRRERATARIQRDTIEVTHEIVAQVLPKGIKRFPEDFVMVVEASQKIAIPSGGLELMSAPRVKNQSDIFAGKPVYKVPSVTERVITIMLAEEY